MLISKFRRGVNHYDPPYAIGDDEFSQLINATTRRGVVSKKLGAAFLGQLQNITASQSLGTTDASGNAVGVIAVSGVSLAPKSLSMTVGSDVYTDDGQGNIILLDTIYGTINYITGSFDLNGASPSTSISATMGYFPGLPVMGLGTYQSLALSQNFFLLAMDTSYAYSFEYTSRQFYSISHYTNGNPISWHGGDYQQFDFQNFQDCIFLTNNVPGMQFKSITTLTAAGTIVTVGVTAHGLLVNDEVFFYEVGGMTQINGLVGTVLSVTTDTFQASVPLLSNPGTYTSGGIIQYLTSSVPYPDNDGIRYYTANGFRNFAPPLQPSSVPGVTVSYLVGCKLLISYGNRLLALGCFTQTSAQSVPTYEPNTIRFSTVNSALYTEQPSSWWESPVGNGGFLTLGGNQSIVSAEISYEQLIIGLNYSYRKVISTGNTILPFQDFVISDVYGSICPFASVLLDNAVMGIANVGITIATTNDSQRIDALTIPDATQEISRNNNGPLRVCAARDYVQQLIYFTYPETDSIFPNKSIVYNYLENNWSFYIETFTCYGYYLEQGSSRTWANVGTWADAGTWGDASGEEFTIQIAGGSPSGSVTIKGNATYNEPNMLITQINGTTFTIPNHNLAQGQYVFIDGCLGVTNVNGVSALVSSVVSSDVVILGLMEEPQGTYAGLGRASIMDNFLIQTKQYIPNWEDAMGSEVAFCLLLLGMTEAGQISGTFQTNFVPFSIEAGTVINTMPDTNLGLTGGSLGQEASWHRMPVLTSGITIQLSLYLSTEQMNNTTMVQSPVVLQSLLLEFKSKGQLLA